MEKIRGKTLQEWKQYSYKDKANIPIRTLKYIIALEERIEQLTIPVVSKQRELLIDFAEVYQNCHIDDTAENTVDWYLRTKGN